MEEYIKIEEYLKNNTESRVISRKKSPLPGVIVLLCGLAVLIISLKVMLPEALKMTLLTVGALAAITGLFMTVMTLASGDSTYIYKNTGSSIKHYRRYINADDRMCCRECLGSGKMDRLGKVRKENSTCSLLHIYLSKDGVFALMQLEEYVPHSFVPVTPVVTVAPEEVAHVVEFVK